MRTEKLENLVTSGMIERQRDKGKQLEITDKMLDGLIKRLKVGEVTDALKATENRDA